MSRFSVIPAAAVLDTRLTLRELSVLAAIGLHTDRDGWCYPSSERLGDLLGVSGAMVRRSIAALTQAGYLQVRKRYAKDGGQTSNLMRVLFDSEHPAEVMRATPDTVGVTPPVTPEVTPPATPEVALTDPINRPTEHKPTARKRAPDDEPFALPDWVPLEPWNEWLKVRKKKRAAATAFAYKLAVEKLDKLRAAGNDPAAVLTRSAFSGWTDLYPLPSNSHESTDPLARRRGESLVDHVQRVNRYHDEREAREREGA